MRALTVLLLVFPMAAAAADAESHEQDVMAWRQDRVERLKEPDGWLSLVGLHWLLDGLNRVGTAPDNDIVLDRGPDHVGSVIREGAEVRFCPHPEADVRVDGNKTDECVTMTSDAAGDEPTTVTFGSTLFYLIDREGHLGLRVKDSRADTRLDFAGIDYFPIDAAWRIKARFEPFDEQRAIEVPDVTGIVQGLPSPGRLVFERNGETFALDAVRYEGDDEFFLIFADRTNGKTTYGAGRYLYTPLPDDDGIVQIDFNKAYNPPCVFTPYATCPLPPPQNRLDLAVTAGEKMYGNGKGID